MRLIAALGSGFYVPAVASGTRGYTTVLYTVPPPPPKKPGTGFFRALEHSTLEQWRNAKMRSTVLPFYFRFRISNLLISPIGSRDQRSEHLREHLQFFFELRADLFRHQLLPPAEFHQRHTLKNRSSGNPEKVLSVFGMPSAVSLGNVQGNRQRRSPQLIDQMGVAVPGKLF